MSKFYFNESAAKNVSTNLKKSEQNIFDIKQNLNQAIIQLQMCNGFDINSCMTGIENEAKTMNGICEKLDRSRGVMRLALAAVQKYEKMAKYTIEYEYCIKNQGHLGNEFNKYKDIYKDFMDTEVDLDLIFATAFSQFTNAGKLTLKSMGKNGSWNSNTVNAYEEYYIAKYMEDMYATLEIADTEGELKELEQFLKYCIDNPKKIGDANLLSAFNISKESKLGQFINSISGVLSDVSKQLETVSDVLDYGEAIIGAIKTQYTDYSKMVEVAGKMEEMLSTYYCEESNAVNIVHGLFDKYNKNSEALLSDYIKNYMIDKLVDTVYGSTLGTITGLVDIPASAVANLDSNVKSYLELRYTENLEYGLERAYQEISEIINSGNYTAENLQHYYDTHQMLKDIYAYRFEKMAVISGDSNYNTMAEEIRSISLD